VGVQAHGHTTVLKINYRNTKQLLQTANLIAADDRDDDGVPLVKPISCGREEACAIADQLSQAKKEGHAWGDVAILCADWSTMDLCADALHQRKLPFNLRKRSGDYNPAADAIQIMTMKASKSLECPVVTLPSVGHMPAKGEDEQEAARVFYVAATRATHRSTP
jgi:superfamily I DNA/RNA helicase